MSWIEAIVSRLMRNFSSRRQIAFYLLALLIVWHALLFYGFPIAGITVAFLALAVWFAFIDTGAALLVSTSLLVFTLLLNGALKLTGLEQQMYYRPHEMLKADDARFGDVYRPNAHISMRAPFGDIQAMENVGIMEPHEITYITDDLGFRNLKPYHGQPYVLVGDSFIAGVNDTQQCLVTEQLRSRHQIDTYNLGFPGGIDDYVNRVKGFRQVFGNDFKVLLFVFEGNDFEPYTGKGLSKMGATLGYYGFFKDSSVWRFTRWIYLRSMKPHTQKSSNALVENVNGEPMAFYNQDLQAVQRSAPWQENQLHFEQALRALQPNLAHVYFVPAKYRIYHQPSLPSRQWAYLKATTDKANIPVSDLTPALTEAAQRLLPQGKFVFWRSDTHWNCEGMQVAADAVARTLQFGKP